MTLLSDKDLLARLMAFDTVSHRSNAPISDFACEYLEGGGVTVERLPDETGEKINVVATCGREPTVDAPAGEGLVLCGHLDTVPADEPDWQGDPYTLTERNGCYFGRGSCDMKGFIALAMNVMREAAVAFPKQPLMLILTHDEEVGSLGAKRFIDEWPGDRPLPRAAIIGEPTSLNAVRMHKGHLKFRITSRGASAHSGSPHLGTNAIEPFGRIITALADLRLTFESQRTDTSQFFPAVPHPVLNLSTIHGGTAVNVIPDSCTLELGVRLLPGQATDEAVEAVRSCVINCAADADIEVVLENENPTLLTDADAPIHTTLCDMLNQTDSQGVSFSSDGGWLSRLGLDCVLFGPGTIEVAHRPNEYVPIDEFIRCRDMLRILIERFCQ